MRAHNVLTLARMVWIAAVAVAVLALPTTTDAQFLRGADKVRRIALFSAPTEHNLDMIYWIDGSHIDASLKEVDYFLESVAGVEIDVLPQHIDVLAAVHRLLDSNVPWTIRDVGLLRANPTSQEPDANPRGYYVELTLEDRSFEQMQKAFRAAMPSMHATSYGRDGVRVVFHPAGTDLTMQDVQRFLKVEGLYGGVINGMWSVGTEKGVRELFGRAGKSRAEGRYREAERFYRMVLVAGEQGWGKEHQATLAVLNNLALSLSDQGRYAEAEAHHRRLLEAQERVVGAEHPDTLANMHNLALTLWAQGRFAEAEVLQRLVLEARERALGPDHPNTLNSMSNLAVILRAHGRYAEAEALDRSVLEARERVLGPDHPNTLSSMSNLAVILRAHGRYAEAEALDRSVLEARERVLGPEHPDTLTSMNNLALSLSDQGRHAEAEALDRRVLEARERVLGPEHPDTLGSMNNLALSLSDQGRHAEAEALDRRVLEARERVLGFEHPDTLKGRHNLVIGLNKQGKHSEALAVNERGFGALPAYFALGGGAVEGQEELLPLNLEAYLRDLAKAAPHDAASRAFAVQGWLSFSRLDVVLSDLAAREGLEEASARALRALQDAREALQAARRAYLEAIEAGPEVDHSVLAARVTTAEKAYEAETARIQRDFPALAEIQLPSALTAEEAQALLAPGEGMMAFAQTQETLHAWLVTRERVEWQRVPISGETLVGQVTELRATLDVLAEAPSSVLAAECALPLSLPRMKDRAFDTCAAQALNDKLLGAFDHTGIDELIVVPDGPLEQLPFSLLVTGTDPDGSPHWLIEDFAISTLPTTSSLRALRQAGVSREEIAEKLPYLGIAPVTFGEQPAARSLRGGQYDLPSTEAEVQQISNLLDPGRDVIVTGDMASESFARTTNLSRYRVISFATHALLSEEATALTQGAITEPALLLHPGDGEDGFLTASEAATLRLDADWVLLSACNTAAGDAEDAEGLSGLARAFFFAGAKALMVSHWPVEDQSAMALMTETMKRSAGGEVSRAQALREAMLAVMNDPDHDWGHPLFWAPFVVVGESRQSTN